MKKVRFIVYPICALVILFAAWNLWQLNDESDKSEELYHSISEKVHAGEESFPDASVSADNPQISSLKKENPDMIGWLSVDGTNIDYPVMQTPDDPEYYLHHSFDRAASSYGTPFLDASCDMETSDNLVIYGHNMKNNTMFSGLTAFQNAEFCRNNGTIRLTLEKSNLVYEVALVMVISEREASKFPYYRCLNLSSKEVYDGFFTRCQQYAVWQAEELPQFGDDLITLSTCEYTKQNGRLVVIGKQISNN